MKEGLMQVTVDAVVFSVLRGELRILLIKRKNPPFKGMFAIPGGFVEKGEYLKEAVARELEEETGIKNVFLKQIHTFGDVERDPRGRIVTIAFLALIKPNQTLESRADAMDAQWVKIDQLPKLAFDHKKIIDYAIRQLRYEIQTTNIAFQILPHRFTLTQLQKLYEAVLNKQLDKRNFRKRIKELKILKATNQLHMEGAHRPARLYEFSQPKYVSIKDRIQVFV